MSGSRHLAVAALVVAQATGLSVPAHGRGPHDGRPGLVPMSEAVIDIPPGTMIPVTLDEDIPIKQDQIGQTYPAHVNRDVTVNGSVAVPEGSPVRVKLVPSSENKDNATLQLTEIRINGTNQPVRSGDARAETERSHKGMAKKTGIGAAAGAVLGAVTGAGLLKGAIVGAGGGLAWGYFGGSKQIGKDTQLEFSVT